MRKLLLIVFLYGCTQSHNAKYEQLQDTIEKLRKKTDFRPLDSREAYEFINNYYLTMLDTMPVKRTLLLYPINAKKFASIFEYDAAELKAKYNNDTVFLKTHQIDLTPPLLILFDKYHPWNKDKLSNIVWVHDTQFHHFPISENIRKAWHNKYPHGYVGISYPLYNRYSNKLYLRELIVRSIGMIDGNAFENEFWFEKTSKGWENISSKHRYH